MSKILLENLKLKNFKGIWELNIDFSKLTDILGDNGTGKTTVFDAFTYLLFDKDSQDRKDFEIKTLDENNNVIHGLEHEVTGTLNIDGRSTVLSKIYKEKWTKKRGEADKQLTGHETLYYIDEVPVKKSEFQERINDIIDEQLFKLLSNPLYFSSNMKWQDRRNLIIDIIGDVSQDRILNYKSSLKGLEILLKDKDVDTLKKSIAAKKKKLNDDIKAIPIRIDECNNSIKDLDFGALEVRKQGIITQIQSVEEQLLDSSKINDELLKEKDRLYSLKSKLRDIEYKAREDAELPLKQLRAELNQALDEENSLNNQLARITYKIQPKETQITDLEKEIIDLREKWNRINQETLVIPEDSFICPTCKRPFEEHDVEDKKHEMTENFNLNKAKKLSEINDTGKKQKGRLEGIKAELKSLAAEKTSIETKLAEVREVVVERKVLVDKFEPVINLGSYPEHRKIKNQIEELETKHAQPAEANAQLNELKGKKSALQNELHEVNSQLTYKEQNEKFKARVIELEEEEKALAQQIAEIEGQEFMCEEYIKTKVELLESSINSKFKFVSFKLFDTQVNGGLVETCEALINGVPFSNANTASQINAGLDIINALSEHYSVSAPIFIDNRESVNEILECNSQIINLIVSEDKKLKVESKESEVA
ncbi:MAG: AAA family ATPase [Bacillota bacterium]|nr:AAA family ATPase [Bacillota bacterium]